MSGLDSAGEEVYLGSAPLRVSVSRTGSDRLTDF